MKRNIFFLFCLLSLNVWATDVEVTTETFQSAFTVAADGDVLIMADGTYTTQITFPSGKTITLKAAQGAKPVYTGNIRCNDSSVNGGGLILDGIDVNHNTGDNYLMNFDNIGKIKVIAFRNCKIHNIGRCFLRTSTTGSNIELIEFTNCLIYDNGANGYNFIYPKHTVSQILVTNTTFYNYATGESFFFANSDNSTTATLNVNITNSTFYRWGKDTSRAILNVGGKYGSSSAYTFTNNIIAEPEGNPQPNIVNASNGGTLTAKNNLKYLVGTYNITNGIISENDLTLAGLGLTNIGFPDPSNGDFSILSTSPLATASTTGGIIGDPRWLKSLSNAVHITTSSSPIEGGAATPIATDIENGQSVKLTAIVNYGYEFSGWSKNGSIISTENPYTTIADANAEYVATFKQLPMYTLTVNKDGEGAKWGKISLSPVQEGNKYVEDTKVSANIVANPVTSFLKWEDGISDLTRVFSMTEDKTITATYDVIPFIVGWDFTSSSRSSATADFFFTTDNTGLMDLYEANGSKTSWGSSTKTFGTQTLACARRYTGAEQLKTSPRYFQAQFSCKGYRNIRVTSKVGIDNDCVLAGQRLLYSTDGTNFAILDSINLTGKVNSDWIDIGGTLPQMTDDQLSTIYLRWAADTTTSSLAANPSGTEGLYLANVIIYADLAAINDSVPPVLLSTTPVEGSTSASTNGNVILYFNERVKSGEGDVKLGDEVLQATFGSKTVSYAYKGLEYGKSYSMTVPAGAIADFSGNAFPGTTLTFTVMNRPQPSAQLFDIIVAADSTGDVLTIQEAIDKCPNNNAAPWLVYVKSGRYYGTVRIPSTKPYIHLIGQNEKNTVITYFSPDSIKIVGGEYTVEVSSNNFYAENISFENAWGVESQAGPMALAMKTRGDRSAFYNCKFRSYQDTWQSNVGSTSYRLYANKCWIEGAVDYFFGDGNAYIENSTFYNMRSGSVITAPSHPVGTKWGFVFMNDTIDACPAAAGTQQLLGRPWQNSPIAVYLNTICKTPVSPEGWTNMGVIPKLFADYNTMDADYNPVDLSHRKSEYYDRNIGLNGTCQNLLSDEEAAAYTYDNVVGGADDWNPRQLFEDIDAPTNVQFNNSTVNWKASPYAICYLIFKDGELMAQTKDTTYNVASTESDNITIRAISESGHPSTSAKAVYNNLTSIQTLSYEKQGKEAANRFNLAGQKVTAAYKGIIIKNNKKIIVR